MRCTACQFENQPDAVFCEQCGQRLERACPSCGTVVGAEARFCRRCGQRLAPAQPAVRGTSSGVASQGPAPGADLSDIRRPIRTSLERPPRPASALPPDAPR